MVLPTTRRRTGQISSGTSAKGADAVFDVEGRVWLGSDLAGFSRRLLRLLAGKRFQLHREATFDELPVGLRQQILVGHSPMNPVCRLVGAREVIQFGDQAIAQCGRLFVGQKGFCGADESRLALRGGGGRRRPARNNRIFQRPRPFK